MTDEPTGETVGRRPVLVTVAIVFAYVSGFGNIALGVLIILSRYQQPNDGEVVFVSLLGAGLTLIGLLTIALASGLARGSRLARTAITVYFGIQLVLHALTIVDDAALTWSAAAQFLAEVFIIAVIWTPPGSRFYRLGASTDTAGSTAVAAVSPLVPPRAD
ncbi:hypothetical protein [Microbacterium sp. P01]|uniref:hypothetical protein n=1 Tax=unclassified Microbacterium TaxID=2609290 RepID=UPI00366B9C27